MTHKLVPTAEKETALEPREATRDEERYLVPPVDIYETEEALVLVADLPGVRKEEVEINVEDNVLTLQARSGHPAEEEYLFQEFGLRNYFRRFELSREVDQSKISANMTHGVLNVTLPKAEKAKPRHIEVRIE